MGLIKPDIGLLFWMIISFGIVFFILKKYAWNIILRMLKEREQSIDQALHSAEKAREEVTSLHADNERILAEARREREQMLKEAREVKEKLLSEAKIQATEEQQRILSEAQRMIENEKAAAFEELKQNVAEYAVDIARKLLKRELSNDKAQNDLIDACLNEYKDKA